MKIQTNQLLPDLKPMLYFNKAELIELVDNVKNGGGTGLSQFDLQMGLIKLRNEERRTLNAEGENATAQRERYELLNMLVEELSSHPRPAAGELGQAMKAIEITLGDLDPVPALIDTLSFASLAEAGRFIESCDLEGRESLRVFGTENGMVANVCKWQRQACFGIPVYLIRDADAKLDAMFTIFQDSTHLGTVGFCTRPDSTVPGVMDKIVELAVTLGRARFAALQAAVPASNEEAIKAFNNAGFEHHVMKGIQPDGNGGMEDRIVFYKSLRTDEDYISAGD